MMSCGILSRFDQAPSKCDNMKIKLHIICPLLGNIQVMDIVSLKMAFSFRIPSALGPVDIIVLLTDKIYVEVAEHITSTSSWTLYI